MEKHGSSISCPQCRRGNPPENRFCGACGAHLERSGGQLVRRTENSPTTASRALLPTELKPVGRALAVGLATLAVEAGLALATPTSRGLRPTVADRWQGDKPAIPEHPIYQSFEEVHAWVREGDFERRIFRAAGREVVPYYKPN